MAKIRVGINGFGRIGRNVVRAARASGATDIDFVAVNDLTDTTTLAHLLKYDSVHGRFPEDVSTSGDGLKVGDDSIRVLSERDPSKLPWGELGVDIVLESTGIFTDREKAAQHLAGGAKKVIISAPAKGEDKTFVFGVNHMDYDSSIHHVISNASCTTNCLVPVVHVVRQKFGFERGFMTTVHSYTNDQNILDLPHKDLRRARAAALSMIPTTTGAAKAVSLVIPDLKGKFDGFAVRVPTPTVSLVDFVADVEVSTTKDDLLAAFDEAAGGRMDGILGVSYEPLVSVDYKGDPRSSIIDAGSCQVMGGTMVKVVTWYDNEWGYSCRVADLVKYVGEKLPVQA